MRLAFNKEITRSITRSWTRFLAIFFIVALGAGFYAGLRMAAPDMRLTVDRYFDETALMDIHLVSTLGFSDADVQAVEAVEGVKAVMPSNIADATAIVGEDRVTLRIHSLEVASARASKAEEGRRVISDDPSYLNRPILVAGRWPERAGECVIDRSDLRAPADEIGLRVALTAGVRPLGETFERTEFTVVGVADTSYYLRFTRGPTTLADGDIDRFLYIADDDFADPETFTDLFLLADGARERSTFTEEYRQTVRPVARALQELAPVCAAERLAEVKRDAQASLDEKRAEYERGQAEVAEQLAQGQTDLDAAAAELAASEIRLASGRRQYEAGRTELSAQVRSFETQADAGQAQIDAGRAEIAVQRAALEQLAAAIDGLRQQVLLLGSRVSDLQTAYDAALAAEALGNVVSPTSAELAVQLVEARGQLATAEGTLAAQKATYDSGIVALTAGERELDARQAELDAGRSTANARFAAARAELSAAKRRIDEGSAALDDGRRALVEGQATYEREKADAEAELDDARAQLDDAQAEIDTLERPGWYVLGRGTNVGFASVEGDANRIDAIALVFPFIFFLVSALVALTTMTRMVDEERTLIGTYKALGYGKGRIAAKYLVYAGVASLFGSVLGILIGSQVLPNTVWNAYKTIYTAPPADTPIDLPLALMAGLSSVGVTILATLFAVENTLREGPATLMLPKAPKPGKRIVLERIGPVWRRMSFSRKVTARNLFRYKKRLLMTVIGIAGCTALLLTGFGLRDAISDVLGKQYGEVALYDTTVGFEPGMLDGEAAAGGPSLAEKLDDADAFSDHLVTALTNVRVTAAGRPAPTSDTESEGVTTLGFEANAEAAGDDVVDGSIVVASDPARLADFVMLRDRGSGDLITLDDSGVVITEKAAGKLGLEVGDELRVEQLDEMGDPVAGTEAVFEVAGITENYVSHYVYVTPELYRRTLGEEPEYNQALARAAVPGEDGRERLSEALLEYPGVTTVQYTGDVIASFDDMLASLDSVVFILIFSAGMLAFIVLYNLTNINVTERTREIATIKVLGFFEAEVNAYIYRETASLTVIGGVVGLALGIALEAFVISTVEIDIVMFGRTIHAMSYFYSAALTLLFALIVNIAMIPRLRGVDMVESLKSVE